MATDDRKGLRFEVIPTYQADPQYADPIKRWRWVMVGADGAVAASPGQYATEAECRSNIASARRRLAGAKFAKVVTVDE